MNKIGAHEARICFSALVGLASKGQHITITLRGIPMATIVPLQKTPEQAVDDLLAYRSKHHLTLGMPFRKAIEEGRR
ncbi:type II toxin-antitoxin system prevent-host-death family antitoxin [bacterium]|nr:type II toxin-antitoxin system prevent-host-death family antitoxin [bacterium]